MKVNLNILSKPYEIDSEIIIPSNYYENTDITELKDVHVKGKVFYNLADEAAVYLECNGIMILKDSNTLENINYPFNFTIDSNINDLGEEINKSIRNNKNVLDIIELLWENIVLEVPIRVTNHSNMSMNGDGWELNSDKTSEEIDPRLEELTKLFKGGE